MFGFRGHFPTRSRRYPTTPGCLRGARQEWRDQRTLCFHDIDAATPVCRVRADELEVFDASDDVVLVVATGCSLGAATPQDRRSLPHHCQ